MKPDLEKNKEKWFYSETVKDHFFNPKNLLKDETEFAKEANGVGEVGSPDCGDVMKFWIKVENNKVTEAKFKTYGCLLGSTRIMTPRGKVMIKNIAPGDYVWGWDNYKVVKAKVLGNVKREVDKIEFNRKKGSKTNYKMYVTKNHLFFINNSWVEASNLKEGDELFHIKEKEWRSLNNVGRRTWLKQRNSSRLKTNNPMFDPKIVKKTVETYKKLLERGSIVNWMQTEMGKRETAKRMRLDNPMFNPEIAKKNRESQDLRPTKIEQKVMDIIKLNNLPIRYVGDGKFWVTDKETKRCKNPDFKVNHQRKLIEVYLSNYPWQKRDKKWVKEREMFFTKQGFKTLFLDIAKETDVLQKIQTFLHNGERISKIRDIKRSEFVKIKNNSGKIEVYDLQLTPPHTFFSWRVLSHNCASAIASTSVLTEMVKGMTIEQALKIKPKDIVEKLGGLPQIKVHCSVLGNQALRAAIKDYQYRTN